jgi:hypothetical protein
LKHCEEDKNIFEDLNQKVEDELELAHEKVHKMEEFMTALKMISIQ